MGKIGDIVEMKNNLYPYDETVYCKDRCVRGYCQYSNLNYTYGWQEPEMEDNETSIYYGQYKWQAPPSTGNPEPIQMLTIREKA